MRRLVKLKKNEKTLTMAAAKSGDVAKDSSQVPEVGKATEPVSAGTVLENSIGSVRVGVAEVKEILKRSPTVEAKAVFDHLCRQQEGAFQQGQLRTLQRRIKQWKAE